MVRSCIERPAFATLQARYLRWQHSFAQFGSCEAGRIAAFAVIGICAPLFALAFLLGARVRRSVKAGRNGETFEDLVFVDRCGHPVRVIGGLPRLIAIARGECAWVGPEPRKAQDLDLRQESHRRLASAQPGLVSPWWVRQRTNIAYGDQTGSDLEFVAQRSARVSLGVLIRALLASFYGAPSGECPRVAHILGLPVDNVKMDEAIRLMLTPRADGRARQVSFLNVDCVNKAAVDTDYCSVLSGSDLRLGDGIGLRIAGRILKSEIRENVNGTDLFPRLCAKLEQTGESLFLLGGRPGVPEQVAAWIGANHPGLRVAGARHGYFNASEEAGIVETINASGVAVVLVALGAPRQEKWIHAHAGELTVKAAAGVGGLFDFYSGRIPRAPQWLREMGLEWAYRLYQEPGRMWRRYLVGNVIFLARVMRERATRALPLTGKISEVISQ